MNAERRMFEHARKRLQRWHYPRVIRHYLPRPADCLSPGMRRIPARDDGVDRLRVPLAEMAALRGSSAR